MFTCPRSTCSASSLSPMRNCRRFNDQTWWHLREEFRPVFHSSTVAKSNKRGNSNEMLPSFPWSHSFDWKMKTEIWKVIQGERPSNWRVHLFGARGKTGAVRSEIANKSAGLFWFRYSNWVSRINDLFSVWKRIISISMWLHHIFHFLHERGKKTKSYPIKSWGSSAGMGNKKNKIEIVVRVGSHRITKHFDRATKQVDGWILFLHLGPKQSSILFIAHGYKQWTRKKTRISPPTVGIKS